MDCKRAISSAVVAAAFVALAAALLCAGCFGASDQTAAPAEGTVAAPAFPLEHFVLEGRRYAYYNKAGNLASRTGVDVSENQGPIAWDTVAADGIDFAFVRIGYRGTTEGNVYKDAYYDQNIEGAQDAGLDCGVYFFSQAITEAEAHEEALFVLETLRGRRLDLPVVFDSETQAAGVSARTKNLSVALQTAIAKEFCSTMEAAGYSAMVYGNGYELQRFALDQLSDYGLWYAEYGALPDTALPYTVWQYTHQGSVAGIDGNVDLNLMMLEAPQE